MTLIFSKKWWANREQKACEKLKADAMQKMHKAVADKKNKLARKEACIAVLKALKRGAVLDATDPVFQYFRNQQTWHREMERLCKTDIDARTKTEQNIAKVGIGYASPAALAALGAKIGFTLTAGNGIGAVIGVAVGLVAGIMIADRVEKFCQKPVTDSQDVWDNFYDSIPSDKGNSGRGSALLMARANQRNRLSLKEDIKSLEQNSPKQKLPHKMISVLRGLILKRRAESARDSGEEAA